MKRPGASGGFGLTGGASGVPDGPGRLPVRLTLLVGVDLWFVLLSLFSPSNLGERWRGLLLAEGKASPSGGEAYCR